MAKHIHIHIGKTKVIDVVNQDVASTFRVAAALAKEIASKCEAAARDSGEHDIKEAQSIRLDLGLVKRQINW